MKSHGSKAWALGLRLSSTRFAEASFNEIVAKAIGDVRDRSNDVEPTENLIRESHSGIQI